MKSARLFTLLFFIPLSFHAQKTLTGVWTGTLSNDSVTVRKDQSFEIVLTQYKNKVYGYSRSTFIVNDTLYYIMKRVKGTIVNDVCEVKDDEILSFNFRGKLDKGIKLTNTFRMNRSDSTWSLAGDWKTNKTKKFYAVTGKVELKDEPDMEKSKIIPHLEELNLAKDIPFYAEAKKKAADDERRKREANMASANTKKNPPVKKEPEKKPQPPVTTKPEPKKTEPIAAVVKEEKNPPVETTIAKQEPKKTEPIITAIAEEKKPQTAPVVTKPEPKKQEPVATVTENKPVITEAKKQGPVAIITEEKKPQTVSPPPVVTKPEPKKQEPVAVVTQKPAEVKKQEPAIVAITEEKKPVASPAFVEKKTIPAVVNQPVIVPGAAVAVNQRKTAPPQEVSFKSDSLLLSLYDNGEVDGDTVSILMNGDIILAKQGLKASAIKKTIYIAPGTDEITLVLYAENLGKYAPNTGLLVIYDGEERYSVRFSADLQQNAAVIFRRKK